MRFNYFGGLVALNDSMGNDLAIANAARVSFNQRKTAFDSKDAKLIKYLAEHKHNSPFRHVQFSITLQNIPEFVLRQLYKHQVGIAYTSGDFRETATVWNEVSGRYVEFDYKFHYPEHYRQQHSSNKQASEPDIFIEQEGQAEEIYNASIANSFNSYQKLLELGVCKEQARILLPLAFETSVAWVASLEALCHFIKLRKHEGAQYEIRLLAEIVELFVRKVCPVASNALLGEFDANSFLAEHKEITDVE